MISLGFLGRCFSVHVKLDWAVAAFLGLAWLEGEYEGKEAAFVIKECNSEHK